MSAGKKSLFTALRRRRFIATFSWWGWPKYDWQFRLYRTVKGGVCVVYGVGSATLRWSTWEADRGL